MAERITYADGCGKAAAYDIDKAVIKLKKLEDMVERILLRNGEIGAELDTLRIEGKKNSYKFKELMGEKLINSNIISVLSVNGLI